MCRPNLRLNFLTSSYPSLPALAESENHHQIFVCYFHLLVESFGSVSFEGGGAKGLRTKRCSISEYLIFAIFFA